MRIHAIQTGRVKVKASQMVGRGHGLQRKTAPFVDKQWSQWLPTYAYAIEHRDGVILVDTGSNTALMRLPRWHPYHRFAVRFDVQPEEEVAPRLRAIGMVASDIRKIVLTHLHMDHDGGLAAFPSAEILVSPGERTRAAGFSGRLLGYLPERWPKGFDPKPFPLEATACGPFSSSRRLTRDGSILAVATPGHTPDHLSVIVEDGDVTFFIAGDASYTEQTMLAQQVDGVSPDEAAAAATLRAIRDFALSRPTVYLPSHDPEAGRRLTERQAVLCGRTGQVAQP